MEVQANQAVGDVRGRDAPGDDLLVVDDDEHVRARCAGCSPREGPGLDAPGPEAALAVLSAEAGPGGRLRLPDAGMSGVEFLRFVKDRWPRISASC